ncbi:MAG: 23S rRNA (adenine(2503)-C(2))-methyltransferase RlmN [Rhodospirillaceae bacterium]|jgi:23S rRNA (adenine2503-C2)-methyltransferase|nr:23S rRNA (adenine(2503)-C(2))-methyltransferase RlmN [Rhodospirillaceae bacterium]MBT3911150.1 23S rRNA (adenine(2503)-C(2))-methyltransferase RlmN [Rhodospirillaceae bacterium]MBT5296922.1 23S rRNA (adenine(2503)-C(2))-methyltransferase RlmN [Rhodospirillaceae bacterium]MBT5513783.1 23S rRNA (adenine(2503)-C(2))-methyltransferase RlmN [Rhodospirillaceae bacterium]MBT6085515.1 23S rRNA (adenine(2503)-C(2))-methyltransferase RlmN [Rhodospirillaceae bacterium]
MSDQRINLAGLSRAEMAAEVAAMGEKPFRAKQLWHWIYFQGETDFSRMTTLSKAFRERVGDTHEVRRPDVSEVQTSEDRTRKWLVRFSDNQEAETVFIPEEDRGAVCISSQVGCTLTCTFCRTGTQKLVRNLSAAEIVGQFMLTRDSYNEWPTPQNGGRMISNIVMMGMGEPLLNYQNVATALKIIMDREGIALSKRRITLSTSGIVPAMQRCGEELGVNLAVSLHAVRDELRDVLVPINQKYPIKDLIEACRAYPGANNARRITFEYVMLKGINDSPADAHELIRLMEGISAKFNLIPFNAWPGALYECSSNTAMNRFAEILNDGGFSAPIRTPRGRDILAACGQLKSASMRAPRNAAAVEVPVQA